MPTRTINLKAEQDAFIEDAVRSGTYHNASEAVRDAVRGLQRQHRHDMLKAAALRVTLQAGIEALERGSFIEVSDERLDDVLDALADGDTTTMADTR